MTTNNKLLLMVAFFLSALVLAAPTFAQSNPVIIATPTPTPYIPPTPTPTPTRNIKLDYSEVSRGTEGDNTELVLAVSVEYNFGEPVMVNFQDFTLNIAVERGGPPPIQAGDYIFTGTAKPIETGSTTKNSFQLTFAFSTLQPNAHGQTPFTNYELVYSGSVTTGSPSPTPTIPEFSAIALLPLVAVSMGFVAIKLFRKCKQVSFPY